MRFLPELLVNVIGIDIVIVIDIVLLLMILLLLVIFLLLLLLLLQIHTPDKPKIIRNISSHKGNGADQKLMKK